jgi:hypothetical protein
VSAGIPAGVFFSFDPRSPNPGIVVCSGYQPRPQRIVANVFGLFSRILVGSQHPIEVFALPDPSTSSAHAVDEPRGEAFQPLQDVV